MLTCIHSFYPRNLSSKECDLAIAVCGHLGVKKLGLKERIGDAMSDRSNKNNSPIEPTDKSTASYSGHLFTEGQSDLFPVFIGNLSIKPREQERMSLGHFTDAHPAKGFSIALQPKPESDDAVVANIVTVGTTKHYELVLHMANYSDTAVIAQVWGMEHLQ